MKKKILFAGDVKGNFEPLLKKISAFDVTFCVGRTLAVNEMTSKVLRGEVEFAKPVYFIDNGPLKNVLAVKYPDGGEICPNLHYLGRAGIKKIQELEVCYLGGDFEPRKSRAREANLQQMVERLAVFDEQSTAALTEQVANDKDFRGVDILLTCGWPSYYKKCLDFDVKEVAGAEPVSRLAYAVKPRYHICGNADFYFERLPYINYDCKGQAVHITRLVGIGQFPEPDAKALQKYLYAIATQPISAIAPEQLLERPQNTTENPYFHLFLESRESQLFAGRTEEVDETEEQIFGTSDPAISAEEAAKINAMTEAASLHVRGFDL